MSRKLEDSYVRIDEAIRDLSELNTEVVRPIKKIVHEMVKGTTEANGNHHLRLPPIGDEIQGRVQGRVKVLCGRVVEHLRSALDYAIVSASMSANPAMTKREKRRLKFIIAHDRGSFDRDAKDALAFVDQDLKDFIERLQPYNGNQVLEFIGEESVISKHHNLLHLSSGGTLEVVLREDKDRSRWESDGWWVFPAGRGHIFTARIPEVHLVIQDRRDALEVLPICIDHVGIIIETVESYLEHWSLNWTFVTTTN